MKYKSLFKQIRSIILIEVGTLLMALSVGLFILPDKILTGGVAGITSLLVAYIPLSEDYMVIFLNTFLFILGSLFLGKEFFMNTLIYSISYPFWLLFVTRVMPDIEPVDPFLASLYGGLIGGVAMGIMFRNGGSSGGTDAIALIAQKYLHIKVSQIIMFMDAVTVLAGLYIYGLNSVLIGLVSVFLTTIAINYTMNIYSGVEAKKFEIISDKYDLIAKDIHEVLERGTTVFDITGGYTGKKKKMLMVIVSEDQYNGVKQIIDKYDPSAFVIISEAKDVNGEGFTFEPRI
ncbi:MAG: YitT family protein [Erysipelotrichaceae bacterium]|nr:YitT family protein [Erysipelotrichaceae bacterium]